MRKNAKRGSILFETVVILTIAFICSLNVYILFISSERMLQKAKSEYALQKYKLEIIANMLQTENFPVNSKYLTNISFKNPGYKITVTPKNSFDGKIHNEYIVLGK